MSDTEVLSRPQETHTDKKPPFVTILGGGPAGLGAAYKLAKGDYGSVKLYEAGDVVGGNAASFDLSGMRVDYGSHRLHPVAEGDILDDIRELLGEDLLLRPRHGRLRLTAGHGRLLRGPCRLPNVAGQQRQPPEHGHVFVLLFSDWI